MDNLQKIKKPCPMVNHMGGGGQGFKIKQTCDIRFFLTIRFFMPLV